MTICLFSAVIFVLFLQFSFGAMNFSTINRCFQNMYKGMFEACVITIGNDGNDLSPYFDKNLLKTYVIEYFDSSVKRYSPNYKASLFFLNSPDEVLCTNIDCNKVTINLDAPINSFFHFQKSRSFFINGRGEVL